MNLNSYALRCVLVLVIVGIAVFVITDPRLQALLHPVKSLKTISQLTEIPRMEPPKPGSKPGLKPKLKPKPKLGLKPKLKPGIKPGPKVKLTPGLKPRSKLKLTPRLKSEPKLGLKPEPGTIKVKYLIYLCDKSRRCGGWGDKQRGIVTAFVFSLLLRRKFGLIMTSNCDILQFYKPHVINWIISENELKGKTRKTLDYMNREGLKLDEHFNPYKHFDVLYLKTNSPAFPFLVSRNKKLMPSYLQGHGSRRHLIFRTVWNRLMQPTERIIKQVKSITESKLPKINHKTNLVCAHVRIGHSIYLPNDRKALDIKTTYKVLDYLDSFKNSRIFVATDHMDVRNSAKKQFGERYIGSYAATLNPDSTRLKPKLACTSFEQALVDQLILSRCDVFVMSPSGFSYYAASLKLKQDNMFLFNGTKIDRYNPV